MTRLLSHHSGSVLPYYLDDSGKLYFVLERKDPKFKQPFFDNGLNFLGGNWKKGVNEDLSPTNTLEREIREEFHLLSEDKESLNVLLGEDFSDESEKREDYVFSNSELDRISVIPKIILQGDNPVKYAGDIIGSYTPPIMKKVLESGSTHYTRALSKKEFATIQDVLSEFSGVVTSENKQWGSSVVAVSLEQINQENMKFAWGYGSTVNHLLTEGYLPEQPYGVIRTLGIGTRKEPMPVSKDVERDKVGAPTYNGFENSSYKYETASN